jgi:4-hydroxy-tetrahydrodipicolinate synthase
MLARAHPQIDLSCGSNSHALEFFAWGARSWVCAGSNFAPEAHIALYQACVIEGDFVKGRAIMSAMLPLMQAFETQGRFVQSVKHGLSTRGIDAGPPRKPLHPLEQKEKDPIEAMIHKMNKSISQITRQAV